jgi:hypothetical protein
MALNAIGPKVSLYSPIATERAPQRSQVLSQKFNVDVNYPIQNQLKDLQGSTADLPIYQRAGLTYNATSSSDPTTEAFLTNLEAQVTPQVSDQPALTPSRYQSYLALKAYQS